MLYYVDGALCVERVAVGLPVVLVREEGARRPDAGRCWTWLSWSLVWSRM